MINFRRLSHAPACLLIVWVIISVNPVRAGDEIVFIVNVDNAVAGLSAREVSDFYLKRKREWPNGSTIRFIDRKESPERQKFLDSILKKNSEEVDRYWIGQKLYSGDSAPMQSPTDSMSIHFVATFKGAIGYISGSTVVRDKNVKKIKVTD